MSVLEESQGTVLDIAEELNRSAFEAIAVCGFAWSMDQIESEGDNQVREITLLVCKVIVATCDHC